MATQLIELPQERKEIMKNFVKAILLAVAYSASIGGTSTLVGTAPNLVLVNQFSAIFPSAPSITFFKWYLRKKFHFILWSNHYIIGLSLLLRLPLYI